MVEGIGDMGRTTELKQIPEEEQTYTLRGHGRDAKTEGLGTIYLRETSMNGRDPITFQYIIH